MFISTNVLKKKITLLVYSWEAVILIRLSTCQTSYVYFSYFKFILVIRVPNCRGFNLMLNVHLLFREPSVHKCIGKFFESQCKEHIIPSLNGILQKCWSLPTTCKNSDIREPNM